MKVLKYICFTKSFEIRMKKIFTVASQGLLREREIDSQ